MRSLINPAQLGNGQEGDFVPFHRNTSQQRRVGIRRARMGVRHVRDKASMAEGAVGRNRLYRLPASGDIRHRSRQ